MTYGASATGAAARETTASTNTTNGGMDTQSARRCAPLTWQAPQLATAPPLHDRDERKDRQGHESADEDHARHTYPNQTGYENKSANDAGGNEHASH